MPWIEIGAGLVGATSQVLFSYLAYRMGYARGRALRPLERAKLLRETSELAERQRQLIEDLEEALRIVQCDLGEKGVIWHRQNLSLIKH